MKKFNLIFLLIFFSALTSGQDQPKGKVFGRLTNKISGIPLIGATTAVYSGIDSSLITGTTTDNDGKFTIVGIPQGNYYLMGRYVGYQTVHINFSLNNEKLEFDAGNIGLTESTTNLSGVDVVATRPQVIYRDDKKILNVDEYRKTGATTLAQVLQNAPSVTTDAEGNVYLRGSSNFTLLIDGKPAPNTGMSMLRQIPPEMVESVEIMTNPSAKYDPEGVSGIINLVLKKQKEAGFNGMITTLAGLGNKYNGDAQFNLRKKKINLFGGVSGTSYQTDISGLLTRETVTTDGNMNVDTWLNQGVKANTFNINAGLDFTFNEKNSLTISSRLGPINQSVEMVNRIFSDFVGLGTTDYSQNSNTIGFDGFFYNPNITFIHKFRKEGMKLQINLFTGGFKGDYSQEMSQNVTNKDWELQPGDADQRESLLSLGLSDTRLKADFESPVGKTGKIEAGFQSTYQMEWTDNIFKNFNNSTGEWDVSAAFSNKYNFENVINALYTTWSGKFGKFSYQAGLRGELNNRLFNQITLDEQFNYDKFSLFPSGNITRTLPKDQQLQVSYSRRIKRPARNNLNPFPQFIDYRTVAKGSPYLRPEYVNSFELSYQKKIKTGFISIQGYFRNVNDLVTNFVSSDGLGNVTMTSVNANRSYSAGTELMGNLQLIKWFRMTLTGNIYYYKLEDKKATSSVDKGTITWTTNSNLIFMITPNTNFSLTGRYNGRSISIQGSQSGNFILNAGLNQTFLKKKASLSLGIQDLLGTYTIKSVQKSENLVFNTEIKPERRVVTLTFTYNFNNFQRRNVPQDQLDMNILR